VVGGLAIIPLVLAATSLIQEFMRWFGTAPPQEHSLLIVFQQPSGTDRLLVILSAVILAPLFEELVFRAHIQPALRKFTNMPWLAVIITSVLFALVHGIWWMMPPLFVLAFGMGYVYERTRNIWAAITIHAAFNALSLTVEYISMKHH
jgi:membrane protease YdiL (CAAX protease family)